MEYQITCTCGHTFQRSAEQLKGPVACPACGMALSVVIQTPTSSAGATAVPVSSTDAEATKRCPFCGEVILAIAKKCKHCGEFLDRTAPSPGTHSIPDNTPAVPPTDEPAFTLTTSQWNNFWRYLILLTAVLIISIVVVVAQPLHDIAPVVILAAMVIAGFIGWFFYLHARNTRIFIRHNRIDVERGILSRSVDSLELFRINDTELKQNLIERIVGIGTIKLMTNDATDEPEMILYEIPRAREVLKYIQTQIPIAARQRGAIYMEK